MLINSTRKRRKWGEHVYLQVILLHQHGWGGGVVFCWAFLRETVNKVKDLPPHICRSPEEGDGSGPSLSFKWTLADPQLFQWICWALPCSPTSTCKRFRLYRTPLLETGTCPPTLQRGRTEVANKVPRGKK